MRLHVIICYFVILSIVLIKLEGKKTKTLATSFRSIKEYCQIGLRRKPFNSRYQYCCEGHIRKKKQRNDMICCARNSGYDITTEVQCCNKSEIALTPLRRAGCCHDELYDEDRYMCYKGFVISKSHSSRAKESRSNHKLHSSKKLRSINFKEIVQPVTVPDSLESWRDLIMVCSSIAGCFFIALVAILSYKSIRKKRKSRQCFSDYNSKSAALNISSNNIDSLDTPTCERNITNVGNHETRSAVQECIETSYSENTFSENNNSHAANTFMNRSDIEKISTESQTSPAKTYNLTNSMGKTFDCHHFFSSDSRSLQLPNSGVKLTLSEQDCMNGLIECFASTFSCLTAVYAKLQNVLTAEETVVSQAVEYLFPDNKTLKEFASVDMDIGRHGRDLHVWRMDSDQGKSKTECRYEISCKDYVNIEDENLDAYYALIAPGKVRIFIKRFCWLVCTVCQGEHYGFSLAAYIYMSTIPRNNLSKKIRLTMYILDDVQQLPDYRTCLHEDDKNLKLVRNIQLPLRVKLEDNLIIQVRLFEETRHAWVPQGEYPALNGSESVLLHYITRCHRQKSNSQAFARDMRFVSRDFSLNDDTFTFEVTVNITLDPEPPGILEEIPNNNFTLEHEVDLSNLKKRPNSVIYQRGQNTQTEALHPASYVQQPEASQFRPHVHQDDNKLHASRQNTLQGEGRDVEREERLVRAESDSNIIASFSVMNNRRLETPNPELSHQKGTLSDEALPYCDA